MKSRVATVTRSLRRDGQKVVRARQTVRGTQSSVAKCRPAPKSARINTFPANFWTNSTMRGYVSMRGIMRKLASPFMPRFASTSGFAPTWALKTLPQALFRPTLSGQAVFSDYHWRAGRWLRKSRMIAENDNVNKRFGKLARARGAPEVIQNKVYD